MLACTFVSVCSVICVYHGVSSDNPYDMNSKYFTIYKYAGLTNGLIENNIDTNYDDIFFSTRMFC